MENKEIIKYIIKGDMPDLEQVRKNCHEKIKQPATEQTKTKSLLLRRSAFSAAAAAALVICIMFGNMLMNPATDNIFILRAYATEQQTDGSIVFREIDSLKTEPFYWHNDGSIIFLNIAFEYEGENIKCVEFYTDDGFFAKQYLKRENGKIVFEEGVTASFFKAPGEEDYKVFMYGDDFDIIGNSFTLSDDNITNDSLLFVGTEVSDWREIPSQITIRAVAAFNDGKTQEEIIVLNPSSRLGMGTIVIPSEEREKWFAEHKKYMEFSHSIPLDKCEVIPGSMQTLTYGDTFEYSWDISGVESTAFYQITEESINSVENSGQFDKNDILRLGSTLPDDGSDGHIAVIVNNGDGTYTGIVYKVPGWLILENIK